MKKEGPAEGKNLGWAGRDRACGDLKCALTSRYNVLLILPAHPTCESPRVTEKTRTDVGLETVTSANGTQQRIRARQRGQKHVSIEIERVAHEEEEEGKKKCGLISSAF